MRKLSKEDLELHPEVLDMQEELSKVSSLEAVADSEGGRFLVENLVKDIVSGMETLANRYMTLSLNEFIAIAATMKSNIDLARVIHRSKKHKDELVKLIEDTIQE